MYCRLTFVLLLAVVLSAVSSLGQTKRVLLTKYGRNEFK